MSLCRALLTPADLARCNQLSYKSFYAIYQPVNEHWKNEISQQWVNNHPFCLGTIVMYFANNIGIHFIERTPISLIILQEDYLRIAVASFPRYGLSLLEVLHEVLLWSLVSCILSYWYMLVYGCKDNAFLWFNNSLGNQIFLCIISKKANFHMIEEVGL